MKMLIVDDNEGNLYLLEALLKGKGYEVASAMNGVEALERLQKDTFDMIISDILMPRMDGFRLCRECKSDDTLKKIPFVFYTATYTENKDEEFGLSLGAVRYILKPIEPARFMKIIEDLVKDYEKDLLVPTELPVEKEEVVYLKEYSERLVKKLERKVIQLEEANKALEERTHDMGERIKELSCVYGVANSIRENKTLEEIFRDVVALIPPGWQYPEITRARLRFDKAEYVSEPFKETEWKQSSDIIVGGEPRGSVEVYYLESRPELDEGPFLKEERQLIDGIAAALSESVEHKRTEEKIRRAAEEWRTTFDSISDFISIHGKDYKVVRVNRALADAVKMKPGELIGKHCYELIHGTKEPHPDCPYEQVQKTKKPSTVEYFEPNFDMYIQASISPIINEEGEFTGAVHIAKDITERKRAEEELQSSEERLKIIFESAPDGYFLVDLKGKIIDANKSAEEIIGINRKEFIGKNFAKLDLLAPGQILTVAKNIADFVLGRSDKRTEYVFNRRDGKQIEIEVSSALIKLKGKTFVLGITRDITKRKQAEAALRESEEKYRQLFATVSDAIVLYDSETRQLLDVNQRAEELYGYTGDEFLQLTHLDISAEPEASDLAIHETLAGYRERIPLSYHKKKDGTVFPVEISTGVFTLGDREIICAVIRDITARKKAEENIERVAKEWRTTFDSISDFILIHEKDYEVIRVNKAFADALKMKPGELIGKHCYELIHGTKEPPPHCLFKQVEKIKKPSTVEFFEPNLGGYIQASISPIINEEGALAGAVHIIKDITERKQAEEALMESEERLKILFEFAPDAYYLNDLKGNFVDGNRAAGQIMGVKEKELIGKSFLKLKILSPSQIPKAAKLLAQNALGHPTGPDEFILNRKDGSQVPVEINTFPIKIKGKTMVLGIAHDITKRKRAEEAIRLQTEDLTLINELNNAVNRGDSLKEIIESYSRKTGEVFSCFGAAIHLLSDDKQYLTMQNLPLSKKRINQIEKLLGFKLPVIKIPLKPEGLYQEILKTEKPRLLLDPKSIHRQTREYINELTVSNDLLRKQLRKIVPQIQKILNMRSTMVVPLISDGEIIGALDISRKEPFTESDLQRLQIMSGQMTVAIKRKRAEEALRKAHDELEQRVKERTADLAIANEQLKKAKEEAEVATQAKSDFLASMSHELRTPLSSIIGFSEVLSDQTFGELNQKQLKYTNNVLTSGHHLLALINDILDLSKVEADKMELEPSTVAIASLLEGSLVMIREKAFKHGISLDLRTPDELSDLKLQADERKLKQIVFNLLSNAVKFTPDGGAIIVEGSREKDELIVAVSDTGIGIKHEDLERVFGKFVQLDSSYARQQKGTGLGLALTRRLVELHGGRIRAESEGEGKGSTFTFVIPIETE